MAYYYNEDETPPVVTETTTGTTTTETPAEAAATAAALSKAGLSNADIAGLTGASMQLNPWMAAAAVGSTIPSFYQAYQQNKQLKELKKRGVTDITPEAFKQYQALVNQQAASSRGYGEGALMDENARNRAAAQANIERLSQTPGQALKASLAANQQAIQGSNRIIMQRAGDMARRRALANEALLKRGMYQDQSRKEFDLAKGALEGSMMQNINKGVQGGLSGVLNSFVIGSPKPKK
jgi:hypothetical protein